MGQAWYPASRKGVGAAAAHEDWIGRGDSRRLGRERSCVPTRNQASHAHTQAGEAHHIWSLPVFLAPRPVLGRAHGQPPCSICHPPHRGRAHSVRHCTNSGHVAQSTRTGSYTRKSSTPQLGQHAQQRLLPRELERGLIHLLATPTRLIARSSAPTGHPGPSWLTRTHSHLLSIVQHSHCRVPVLV